jgi:hypothetical protein
LRSVNSSGIGSPGRKSALTNFASSSTHRGDPGWPAACLLPLRGRGTDGRRPLSSVFHGLGVGYRSRVTRILIGSEVSSTCVLKSGR